MDFKSIIDLLKSAFQELYQHRILASLVFIVVLFGIFFVGTIWPHKYATSALVHANHKNIIEPLMRGRAQPVTVSPVSIVIETLYSPRILQQAALDLGMIDEDTPDAGVNIARNQLSTNLSYEIVGKQLLKLTMFADNPDFSFRALNTLLDVFSRKASLDRQDESTNAYNFISNQVDKYKEQLSAAERRLSTFKSKNFDLSEKGVEERMSDLRIEIENLDIGIQENNAKVRKIKSTLSKESRFQEARTQLSDLLRKKSELESALQTLELSFKDDYPDIVSTRIQLKTLNFEIDYLRDSHPELPSDIESDEETLYDQLRGTLSETEIEIERMERRKSSLQKLVDKEIKRADKVNANQAALSELTRDYDKTQQIYEEMLQRRENAKLSMNIDKEGQNMSFRVREQPVYPVAPTGLQGIHFILAAPVLGVLLPLSLCLAYVFLDPRIRSKHTLLQGLPDGIELLGAVPEFHKKSGWHISFSSQLVIIFLLLGLAAYAYFVNAWFLTQG